ILNCCVTPDSFTFFCPVTSLTRRSMVRVAVWVIVRSPVGSGRLWHGGVVGVLEVEACHRLVLKEGRHLGGAEATRDRERRERMCEVRGRRGADDRLEAQRGRLVR